MSHSITQDYATLPLPFTTSERQELTQLETTVRNGLHTFYAVGTALTLIRNRKLYREEFRTFEEYCQVKFNIARPTAYRLMDAADTKDNLSPLGDVPLPENEAQTRALAGLEPEQQRHVWTKAMETAPNGKVTAKHVQDVRQVEIPVEDPEPPPAPEPERQISVFIPPKPTKEERKTAIERAIFGNQVQCAACGKRFPPEHIVTYQGRQLHTDCYYEALRKEQEPDPEPPKIKSCDSCPYHKMMGSPKPGVRIPDGQGKCIRPEGHCDPDIVTGYISEGNRIRHPEKVNITPSPTPPEPAPTQEPEEQEQTSVGSYTCTFCDQSIPADQVILAERGSLLRGVICAECAANAARQLLPGLIEGFEWYMVDRSKIVNAGLRIIKPGGRLGANELQELLPMKSGQNSYSWRIIERFETKAALKRRMDEFAKEPNVICENHL